MLNREPCPNCGSMAEIIQANVYYCDECSTTFKLINDNIFIKIDSGEFIQHKSTMDVQIHELIENDKMLSDIESVFRLQEKADLYDMKKE